MSHGQSKLDADMSFGAQLKSEVFKFVSKSSLATRSYFH